MATRTRRVGRGSPGGEPETLRVGADGVSNAGASLDEAAGVAAVRRRSTARRGAEDDEERDPRTIIRPLVTVVLTGPLELDDKRYPAGQRLTLPEDEAQEILDAGDATRAA